MNWFWKIDDGVFWFVEKIVGLGETVGISQRTLERILWLISTTTDLATFHWQHLTTGMVLYTLLDFACIGYTYTSNSRRQRERTSLFLLINRIFMLVMLMLDVSADLLRHRAGKRHLFRVVYNICVVLLHDKSCSG